jgi:hypothetical protein
VNLHPDADFPQPEDDEYCTCDACKAGLSDEVEPVMNAMSEFHLAKQTFQQLNNDIMRWLFALSYLTVHAHQHTGKGVKLTIGGVSMNVSYSPEESQVDSADDGEDIAQAEIETEVPKVTGWQPAPDHGWLN